MTGSFVGNDGREWLMFRSTRLVLAGVVLSGTVLLSAGSAALASNDRPEPSPANVTPAATPSTAGQVDIGTAEQWIRLPDGTIRRVL